MVSAREGWAVGGSAEAPTSSLILHYMNGTWYHETSPVYIPLSDLTMVSATEGWAVGGGQMAVPGGCHVTEKRGERNILLHYTHGEWQAQHSPTNAVLRSITMIPDVGGFLGGWDHLFSYQQNQWQSQSYTP